LYIVSPVRRDDSDDRCQEAVARRDSLGKDSAKCSKKAAARTTPNIFVGTAA